VQLSQELELVERYLDIERIRFGSRLSVTIDVPTELMSVTVPALLWQPLVENAITHGISQISTTAVVRVRAWVEGRMLHLEVRDNGPGPLGKVKRPGRGIGVSNLRARLERLYGDEPSIGLHSAPEGGCVAAVTMPMAYVRSEPRRTAPRLVQVPSGSGVVPESVAAIADYSLARVRHRRQFESAFGIRPQSQTQTRDLCHYTGSLFVESRGASGGTQASVGPLSVAWPSA